MQQLIREARAADDARTTSSRSAHPRIVDGKPSKNPRYLQIRPDLVNPRDTLSRGNGDAPAPPHPARRSRVHTPVNAVLPGRRNNPPEAGHPPAGGLQPDPLPGTARAVHGVHLQHDRQVALDHRRRLRRRADERPVQRAAADHRSQRRARLVSAHRRRRLHHRRRLRRPALPRRSRRQPARPRSLVPHDAWPSATRSRSSRDGYLEKCEDFEHDGRTVLASRLGYRITQALRARILRPHLQSSRTSSSPRRCCGRNCRTRTVFADGMDNIVDTQRRVAQHYFDDGSIAAACPPLRALLHIMRDGHFRGQGARRTRRSARFSPARICWRATGTPARLASQAGSRSAHSGSVACAVSRPFSPSQTTREEAARLSIAARLERRGNFVDAVKSPEYLQTLRGTIGTQPLATY